MQIAKSIAALIALAILSACATTDRQSPQMIQARVDFVDRALGAVAAKKRDYDRRLGTQADLPLAREQAWFRKYFTVTTTDKDTFASLLYPPGRHEILGYRDGEVAVRHFSRHGDLGTYYYSVSSTPKGLRIRPAAADQPATAQPWSGRELTPAQETAAKLHFLDETLKHIAFYRDANEKAGRDPQRLAFASQQWFDARFAWIGERRTRIGAVRTSPGEHRIVDHNDEVIAVDHRDGDTVLRRYYRVIDTDNGYRIAANSVDDDGWLSPWWSEDEAIGFLAKAVPCDDGRTASNLQAQAHFVRSFLAGEQAHNETLGRLVAEGRYTPQRKEERQRWIAGHFDPEALDNIARIAQASGSRMEVNVWSGIRDYRIVESKPGLVAVAWTSVSPYCTECTESGTLWVRVEQDAEERFYLLPRYDYSMLNTISVDWWDVRQRGNTTDTCQFRQRWEDRWLKF